MRGHDTFITLDKDHALTTIPHGYANTPHGDPAHGIHTRLLIVRLGYMAGGVVETAVAAVPALCQGSSCLDWIDSHVKCNLGSIRHCQDRKSFPLPSDLSDVALVHVILPSEKRILIRRRPNLITSYELAMQLE